MTEVWIAAALACFFASWTMIALYRDERRKFNERRRAAGLLTLDELQELLRYLRSI